MENDIKLSVLVVTYNHEKYIEEAMESILFQKFTYPYEIVFADDCSTDTTPNIIKRYKERYPDKIKILSSEKNLGITRNYKRGFAACKGEYIAVLEGDDHWTSPYKLQKHVDFLDNHRECVLSFNRFVVSDMGNRRYNIQPWPINDAFQLITVTDLVRDNFIGNFSTCVYRAEIIKNLNDDIYDLIAYDWMINLAVAQSGLIGYLPEVMSVYRLHPKGTWTQKSEVDKLEETILRIDEYNEYLGHKYTAEFDDHKGRLYLRMQQLTNPEAFQATLSRKERFKRYLPPIVIKFVKLILPPRVLDYLREHK